MINVQAPIHTAERPYCRDVACWCHNQPDYHLIVTRRIDSERQRQEDIRRFEQRRQGLTLVDLRYLIQVAHAHALRTSDNHERQLILVLVEKLARIHDEALEAM